MFPRRSPTPGMLWFGIGTRHARSGHRSGRLAPSTLGLGTISWGQEANRNIGLTRSDIMIRPVFITEAKQNIQKANRNVGGRYDLLLVPM